MSNNRIYKKLGELATFSRGLTFSKADVADVSSKKVLRSNNIDLNSHSLNYSDVACLNETFVIPDEKKLHKGDIFICMSNGSTQHLGKVAFIEDDIDYAFGGFMGAIHPNVKLVYPKYVFYSCLSTEYRRYLASVLNGVNINNLKWSELSNFSIPVPPLATQSQIVSELDLLQSLIDKQKAQLKELDNLAQAIFYDMFGDPVENEKGWEVKKLGEIGKIVTGNTPSRQIKEYYDTPFIEWIKSDNLSNNYIYASKAKEFLSKSGSSKGRIIPTGSILVTCIAGSLSSIGTASMINRTVSFNQQINAIIPNEKLVSNLFVLHTIRRMGKRIQDNATNGMKHIITKSVFKNIPIILPPLSLQQTFAAKIESIEKQKAAISKSLAETQRLFDYTMDKYFG